MGSLPLSACAEPGLVDAGGSCIDLRRSLRTLCEHDVFPCSTLLVLLRLGIASVPLRSSGVVSRHASAPAAETIALRMLGVLGVPHGPASE